MPGKQKLVFPAVLIAFSVEMRMGIACSVPYICQDFELFGHLVLADVNSNWGVGQFRGFQFRCGRF